jgi:hypothetical protein
LRFPSWVLETAILLAWMNLLLQRLDSVS